MSYAYGFTLQYRMKATTYYVFKTYATSPCLPYRTVCIPTCTYRTAGRGTS